MISDVGKDQDEHGHEEEEDHVEALPRLAHALGHDDLVALLQRAVADEGVAGVDLGLGDVDDDVVLGPEGQRQVAGSGVGAVTDGGRDVEDGLVEVEGGEHEVVRQLVLVGEDEVVEAGLVHLEVDVDQDLESEK